MPLPVIGIVAIGLLGAAIFGVSSVSAVSVVLDKKAKKKLKSSPNGIPRPPRGMTRDQLKLAAQKKLGIDVTRYFNFAFCGGSGAGKSSLINALRNMDDVDFVEGKPHDMYDSAPTGEWQTTTAILGYAYPQDHDLQYVRLWDMAGCGTHEHPSLNYFEEKVLYAFDVLILVVDKELGEYEYAILNKAQQQKIPVVIAITKAEEKVEAKMRKAFNTRNPPLQYYRQIVEDTVEEARQRISVCLQKKGLQIVPIFIVSAWKYRDFMRDQDTFINIEHQEIHVNQSFDENELVGQEVSDQGINNPGLIDQEAQRQEIARRELHEKNTLLSFELHQLLNYIAEEAVQRRL